MVKRARCLRVGPVENVQNLSDARLPFRGGLRPGNKAGRCGGIDGFGCGSGFCHTDIILSRNIILVAALALAAFGWSIRGSFHFDDYSLFQDPVVTSPSGVDALLQPLATRPLTYLTFRANYEFGGRNPVSWHAVNLALHVAAALLLFAALRRLIPERIALLGAAFFAVHPLQSEPVNYVFERATVLSTALVLASLWNWAANRRWLAVVWFAAALLAKEECAAFPLVLLLLSFTLGGSTKRDLPPIAVMLGLSALAGVRVILDAARHPASHIGPAAGIPASAYAATQGAVILRYLRMLAIPTGLTVDPEVHVIGGWHAWLGWLAVAALSAGALWWFLSGRDRDASAVRNAALWFIAGIILLLPSSSIFPAADLAADRRMYLPMIALAVAGAYLLSHMRTAAVAVICASFIILSISRCEVWRTELSLWSDAVRKAPDKVRPRLQLARALPAERALDILTETEHIAPEDPAVAAEQGRAWLEYGDPARALAAFGRALALNPEDPAALNNRGVALLALGQTDAARLDFERALRVDACSADAAANLRHTGVATELPKSCPATPWR